MKKNRFYLVLLIAFCLQSTNLMAQGFGGAMAVAEHAIFVGEAGNNHFPGSVYVYADNQKPGTWIESERLEPDDGFPGDRFGHSMDATGDVLLVGMSGYEESTGAVVVYERSTSGRWVEEGRLMADDALPDDRFGSTVVFSEGIAAVAAPGRNKRAGGVYIFSRQEDGSWNQHAFLEAEDTVEGDVFGTSMSAVDNLLLVGAPGHNEAKGAAYLFSFDRASGSWESQNKFHVPDMGDNSQLGQVVALGDATAYVASPRMNNRRGVVYAFNTRQNETARRVRYRTLTAYDAQTNGRFGSSIIAANDELWIGAPGDNRIGSAYLFRGLGPQGWTSVEKITGDDLSGRASFASAMLRKDGLAVFGATGLDGGEGAALIFAKNEENNSWAERQKVINDVKGFDAITGSEIKCENEKAAAFDCKSISLMSFLPIKAMGGSRGVRVNDIWGWTVRCKSF